GSERRKRRHRLEPRQRQRQRAGLDVDGISGRRHAASDGDGRERRRQRRAGRWAAGARGGTLSERHLVREIVRPDRREMVPPKPLRQVINANTAATLTTIMEDVVLRGTGKKAQLDDYQVAGKTGTAAKLVDGRYSHSDYNVSFVGFVPSRRPVLTILVVVDTPRNGSPYGGTVAAPIFRRIAEASLRQLAIPPEINPPPGVLATH